MIECEVVARKWGHSLGVELPKNVVEEEGIKENEKIRISIKREDDAEDRTARKLFGMVKFKKPTQQWKDEIRKELYND